MDLLHQKALLQEKRYVNIKYNNVILNFDDRLDENKWEIQRNKIRF